MIELLIQIGIRLLMLFGGCLLMAVGAMGEVVNTTKGCDSPSLAVRILCWILIAVGLIMFGFNV
jgi:hypothetical protein